MKFNPQPKKGMPAKKPRKPIKRTPLKRKVTVKGKKPSLDSLRKIAEQAKGRHKPRKVTGELALFKEIWNEREHVSEVSGKRLWELTPHNMDVWVRQFSHILTKAAYPDRKNGIKMRLNKENIVLMTPEEHAEWEHGDRNDPKWNWVKEKAEQLKQEYYGSR